jgi:hypothetical protein
MAHASGKLKNAKHSGARFWFPRAKHAILGSQSRPVPEDLLGVNKASHGRCSHMEFVLISIDVAYPFTLSIAFNMHLARTRTHAQRRELRSSAQLLGLRTAPIGDGGHAHNSSSEIRRLATIRSPGVSRRKRANIAIASAVWPAATRPHL